MILSRDLNAQRIIRTYLTITGLFNGALALIWGVNTLFLLQAGLDIFHVMLVNAAFSFAEFVFEVPTGVVADTLGRRVSLLFCLITLLGATLAYVALPALGLGFWSFVLVSIALGLGFTFWSGAAEAWLVDALKHAGYDQPIEGVFAKSQIDVRRRDADRDDGGRPARPARPARPLRRARGAAGAADRDRLDADQGAGAAAARALASPPCPRR